MKVVDHPHRPEDVHVEHGLYDFDISVDRSHGVN